MSQIFCKGSNFHRTFITFALFSYRNFIFFSFFFAYNEHVGYAFELIVADFLADFFVSVVNECADVGLCEGVGHAVGVVVELLADGENHYLVGCEPEREASGCVLEQYGYEAFH